MNFTINFFYSNILNKVHQTYGMHLMDRGSSCQTQNIILLGRLLFLNNDTIVDIENQIKTNINRIVYYPNLPSSGYPYFYIEFKSNSAITHDQFDKNSNFIKFQFDGSKTGSFLEINSIFVPGTQASNPHSSSTSKIVTNLLSIDLNKYVSSEIDFLGDINQFAQFIEINSKSEFFNSLMNKFKDNLKILNNQCI